jgi:hypothetical protein
MATQSLEVYHAERVFDPTSGVVEVLSDYGYVTPCYSILLSYSSGEDKTIEQVIDIPAPPLKIGGDVRTYFLIQRSVTGSLGDLTVNIQNAINQHNNYNVLDYFTRKTITVLQANAFGIDSMQDVILGRSRLRITVKFAATTTVAVNVRIVIFQA